MRLIDLLTDPVRLPVALSLAAALARVVYAIVSRVVAPLPRVRAIVEAVAALLPDVLRFALQMWAAWTGRPAPKLDAVPLDPAGRARLDALAGLADNLAAEGKRREALLERLVAAERERDELARRVAELTARDDGTLRPAVVPGEEPAGQPRPPPVVTTRHRIVGATLAALGLALAGCPKLPPVSGCEPLEQRCDGDRPQVCSPTQRWHTVGDEPCGATPGQSCQVHAGVAGCAR